MADSEVNFVNKIVRRFDRELKAHRTKDGVVRVSHFKKVWQAYDVDGVTILAATESPYLVFSLTDTWGSKGKPVKWGYEPLYAKLREISLERQHQLLADIKKRQVEADEAKDRARFNLFQDIAYESRDVYKKTFSDVNTGSMDKSKDPRRRFDRSIKYGNR